MTARCCYKELTKFLVDPHNSSIRGADVVDVLQGPDKERDDGQTAQAQLSSEQQDYTSDNPCEKAKMIL